MKNALRFLNNKSLLEIDTFETHELRLRFHEVADVLLNQVLIEVGKSKYRICEIEFYVYSENHQDPYTHKHPEQLNFGEWYFHQIETKNGFAFKGGKYQGVDLTLGDGHSFVGILIRSIEAVNTGVRVDGPSKVVDEFLSVLNVTSVSELAKSESEISLILDSTIASREYFMGPRVGLSPPTIGPRKSHLDFLFFPFRYITEPNKTKKGKVLLFLHQMSLYGVQKATTQIGVREVEAKKYLKWFESGYKQSIDEIQIGNSIESMCAFFGAYHRSSNSDSSSDSAHFEEENNFSKDLLEHQEIRNLNIEYVDINGLPLDPSEIDPNTMSFEDECGRPVDEFGNLIDGESDSHKLLKKTQELLGKGRLEEVQKFAVKGFLTAKNEAIQIEFLKLQAVALGGLGDHKSARSVLLSVLNVCPDDGYVLANYVTSCLASGDPMSAVRGIDIYYTELNGSSKGAVLNSLAEALSVGDINLDQLPEVVLSDLNQFIKKASA